MTRRTAWGRITKRIVLPWDSPRERAAAVWLQWMLSIPARYTSAYAPYSRVRASAAKVYWDQVLSQGTPAIGMPKPIM